MKNDTYRLWVIILALGAAFLATTPTIILTIIAFHFLKKYW